MQVAGLQHLEEIIKNARPIETVFRLTSGASLHVAEEYEPPPPYARQSTRENGSVERPNDKNNFFWLRGGGFFQASLFLCFSTGLLVGIQWKNSAVQDTTEIQSQVGRRYRECLNAALRGLDLRRTF